MKQLLFSTRILKWLRIALILAVLRLSFGANGLTTAYAVDCSTSKALTLITSSGGTANAVPAPDCGSKYHSGAMVTLTASPNTGFTLIEWRDGTNTFISASNPISITMDADKKVIAVFFLPPNDNFDNATLITGLTFNDSVNTVGATTEGQGLPDSLAADPQPVGDGITTCTGTGTTVRQMNRGSNTVWYTYTPPVTEFITLDTIGSSAAGNPNANTLDTYIAVWTGSKSSLSLVTCNDDSTVGFTSYLSFTGTAGVPYYIEVASFNCYYDGVTSCPNSNGGNLLFHANISNTSVYMGNPQPYTPIGSYYVPPGLLITPQYTGVQTGPVEVTSTNPFFTSERALFGPYYTFNEVMGVPNSQLTNHYWFTWYDNKDMTTWVLVGNPSSSQTAHVTIKIAGQTQTGYNNTPLGPKGIVTPTFGTTQTGPVEIISDIPIITSERALYGSAYSFNEVMGFPNNQLTTDYWFTWYDNKDMLSWVLAARP